MFLQPDLGKEGGYHENARNQHRTDYAKELIKIVQTTKDREELKKRSQLITKEILQNAIVESDKTVRKCIYDILDIADIAEIFSYIEEGTRKISGRNAN